VRWDYAGQVPAFLNGIGQAEAWASFSGGNLSSLLGRGIIQDETGDARPLQLR
jgi:hypothetical protein